MPPPDDNQLTPPFESGGTYRPPRNMLGDFQLKLDPITLDSRQGWLGLPAIGGPPKLLGPTLGNGLDDPLRNALGNWSANVAGTSDPKTLLDQLLLHLDDDMLKGIAEAMYDKFATDATVPGKTNIVTREPVTIGKLGPDGSPRQADGTPMLDDVDSLVPHSDFLSLHKNFKFNSVTDVKVSLLIDKDAILAGQPKYMVSGASAEVSVKTSWGEDVKLTIIGGRDQAGGPTGALMLGFKFKGP